MESIPIFSDFRGQGYGDELKKRRRKMIQKKDLGINSVPVGSEDIIEMYPLDFEEFLWANGLNQNAVNALARERSWANLRTLLVL